MSIALAALLLAGGQTAADAASRDYDLSCAIVDRDGAQSRFSLSIAGPATARRLSVSKAKGTPFAAVDAAVFTPSYSHYDDVTDENSEGFQVRAGGKVYSFLFAEHAGPDGDEAILRLSEHNDYSRDYARGVCFGKRPMQPLDVAMTAMTAMTAEPQNDFYRPVPTGYDVNYAGRCTLVMTGFETRTVDLRMVPGEGSSALLNLTPVKGKRSFPAVTDGRGRFTAIRITARDVPSRSYTFASQSFIVSTDFGPTIVTVDRKGQNEFQTWVEVRRAAASPQGSAIIGAGWCTATPSSGK